MSCFPCFSSEKSENSNTKDLPVAQATGPYDGSPQPANGKQNPSAEARKEKDEANTIEGKNIGAQTFTFRELAAATKNFRQQCLLGEGGFGRVFKGTLQPSGQVVAVKQLDRNGMQANKEFLAEVLKLSLLHHPNLVNLIGYCADGDQRLLVYEYMPLGSVQDHLLDISEDKKPLDWLARMKLASGAAQGLEYLHEKANPSIIYRDLKSSNILLDEEFNPRLSDFGLAKLGLGGNEMHVSPRVMGTYGYCAPEYERTGELTLKSDVYSFGVVLLELITGRRAIDTTRPTEEQNLVSWAQPFFRDPKKFPEMADPLLHSIFPVRGLNQAVGVAAMCLQEEPSFRPLISDVVATLSFLMVAQAEVVPSPLPVPNQPSEVKVSSEPENHHNRGGEGDSSRESSDEEDGDSASHHEDGDSLESSDDDDDRDSIDHHEEDNMEKRQGGQTKKTVKWALNSRCKSKVESQDGSVGSSSSSSPHINIECHDKNSGKNLKSNSVQKSEVDSQDGSVGSSSSHNSDVKWGSILRRISKMESQDGISVGSSSRSSHKCDVESQGGSSGQNSRSNSDAGRPKYGSNSRQDSNVESQEDGSAIGSNLRRNSHVELQEEDGSVFTNSGSGWNSRHFSSVTSHDAASVSSSSRSSSDLGSSSSSEDGSVGSNSRRNSNAGSHHESAFL